MSDHDFNTSPWILDLVRQLDSYGQIGLDPCSNRYSMVRARHTYDVSTNGLTQTWRGYGLVYVNPPHSMSPYNIEPWMEKAAFEFINNPIERENNPTRDQLCMLVPMKSDTAWFHNYAIQFKGHCFLRGRPKYWHRGKECPGSGKFPSMILYIGSSPGRFMQIFSPYGWCI